MHDMIHHRHETTVRTMKTTIVNIVVISAQGRVCGRVQKMEGIG